ncbi:MAG: hypothetical protein OXT65_12255 [Alphaproteobacteria bacterium]|nr:hypothetical protein [Alphaproteobacteria bacterium]
MIEQENRFYNVFIHKGDGVTKVYRIRAHSDYEAARKVRDRTGFMAASEKDVAFADVHAAFALNRLPAVRRSM